MALMATVAVEGFIMIIQQKCSPFSGVYTQDFFSSKGGVLYLYAGRDAAGRGGGGGGGTPTPCFIFLKKKQQQQNNKISFFADPKGAMGSN